jgi:hypothetical protein
MRQGFERSIDYMDPLLQRPMVACDIVIWKNEPHFPRSVADVAAKNALLLEPGDQIRANPLRVRQDFLLPPRP